MTTIPRRWLLVAVLATALLAGCASALTPGGPAGQPAASDQRPANLTPRRAPSKTMEVWVAAWEDARGDLHAPSTLYIEVDPTRWTYGEGSESSRYSVLRPLQVEERPPAVDSRGAGAGVGIAEPVVRTPAPPTASRRGA